MSESSELTAEGFVPFFAEVTSAAGESGRGHEPFLWQVELVRRLLAGDVPEVIDVPTGFGKTSVISAWAYALAASAALSEGPRLARRLFFVVDRRLVVDGAFEDALCLSTALAEPVGPMTETVAARLCDLHGDASLPPVSTVRMRGGTTWDARWLPRPDQAAVIVGTVDQFGSRLLFRGYGTSPRMRPIDAALTGTDGWLVIDEAHIATPLVRTARSVAALQQVGSQVEGVRPLRVTTMSATSHASGTVLRADLDAQTASTELPTAASAAAQRADVTKPVDLVDITNLAKAGAKTWRRSARRFGETLAGLAHRTNPDARIVGVIANTVGTARAAHEWLTDKGEAALLMIGRSRAWERELLLESDALERARVGASRSGGDERLYVVATQTIEVGANLDFDLLVTEAAPLPSLIQRFGRVNRLGHHDEYRSAVVHAGFAHGEEDPVYGSATAATWRALLEAASAEPCSATTGLGGFAWPDAPVLDLGLRSARRLAASADDHTRPGEPFTPVLLSAHIERWTATTPVPQPDQDPGPFLHGVDYHTPSVAVAWRLPPPGLVDDGAGREPPNQRSVVAAWRDWLELVRPSAWEFVEVPVWEVRGLLADREPLTPTTDLEADLSAGDEVDEAETTTDRPLGVVYRGTDEWPTLVWGGDDVQVGDRLVLTAHVGGHDTWGWTGRRHGPDERPVPDVADLVPGRRRQTLRLARGVLASVVAPDRHDDLDQALAGFYAAADEGDTDQRHEHLVALLDLLPPRASDVLAPLREPRHDIYETGLHEDGRMVVLAVARRQHAGSDVDQTSDDDTVSTSLMHRRQTLADHGAEVGALARAFAERLGLAERLVRTVETAARWHDLGKADPRFQLLLHDGDELAAAAATEPLAKSGRDPRDPVARRAAAIGTVPRGFRHEAVSARLADELVGHLDPGDGVDLELLHHLVVSHHGWARPLLPPLADPGAPGVRVVADGQEVKVDGAPQVDWDQPGRFERLNARYGPWQLALLETLVRLADIRCSEMAR